MEHKISYKTKDGIMREQRFDDFNEFADMIENIATKHYAGERPEIDVETIYDNITRQERVTDGFQGTDDGTELLREEN